METTKMCLLELTKADAMVIANILEELPTRIHFIGRKSALRRQETCTITYSLSCTTINIKDYGKVRRLLHL